MLNEHMRNINDIQIKVMLGGPFSKNPGISVAMYSESDKSKDIKSVTFETINEDSLGDDVGRAVQELYEKIKEGDTDD